MDRDDGPRRRRRRDRFGWTANARWCAAAACAATLARTTRGGARARDDDRIGRRWTFHARVFEYVEGGPLAWEAVSTAAYVGAGRRGRRAATAMAIAVAMMAHGARWTIGVLAFVCAFYAFAVAVRAAPFSARRKRTYVWVACVLAYLVLDELESEPGDVARVGIMNATTFNCYRACRFDLLRVMCFGVECVEESATPDLGKFVRYVLYPPLRAKGPFCFYREFERHRCDHDRRRWLYAALETVDSLTWYALLEFAHRTYYDPFADVADASLFEKISHAWTHTTAIWAGPTLIFNLSHALAVIDGQVVIRDVSVDWLKSGTSFGTFWRKFHCSLHEAFVRLLYRPLGSSVISVVVVMAFSLLFHGLKSKAWFVFFGANTAGVVFERCCHRLRSSDRTAAALYQTALFVLFTKCTTNISIDARYVVANFVLFWWNRRARDEDDEGDD